jgi:hypothetical protein
VELFARRDGVEAAWCIVSPALGYTTPAHEYEPGTWGGPAHRAGWRQARPLREGGSIVTTRAGFGTIMTRSHRLAHASLGAWISMLAPMSAPSQVAAQTPAAPAEIKRPTYQVRRFDENCTFYGGLPTETPSTTRRTRCSVQGREPMPVTWVLSSTCSRTIRSLVISSATSATATSSPGRSSIDPGRVGTAISSMRRSSTRSERDGPTPSGGAPGSVSTEGR